MTECLCDRVQEQQQHQGVQTKALVPVAAAKATLNAMAQCRVATEQVTLENARGRILAETLRAIITVPPHDNSAMDGYGLCLAELARDQQITVSQRVPAGQSPTPLQPGTAVRIFTGAPIPEGVDTVVPQEQVNVLDPARIEIQASPVKGQNIRRAGEDMQAGRALLAAGTRLEAAEIGLLASQGIADIPVFKPLRVAIVTTGDELVMPGQRLEPGQIYNSNSYTLRAALQCLGCDVTDVHTIADNASATRDALKNAARDHDLVITTGGVSVGDEDHIRPAVEQLGQLEFWGVAMKPGKPFAFGQIGETPFLGLPGNPMATLVTFEILAIDFIRVLMGTRPLPGRTLSLPAGFSRSKTTHREEYVRVRLDDTTGRLRAVLAGSQSSGVLSVASASDGYLIIPPQTPVTEGTHYDFVDRDHFYR